MDTRLVETDNKNTFISASTSRDGSRTRNELDPSETADSTSKRLEDLTHEIINGVKSRRFETHASMAYFSPDFKGQTNDHSTWYPLDQHIELTKQLTIDYPELCIHVLNISTHMGYRDLCADVFVDMEHTRYPPGVVRRCLGVFHWKRFDQKNGGMKWLCMRHTGARGVTGTETAQRI